MKLRNFTQLQQHFLFALSRYLQLMLVLVNPPESASDRIIENPDIVPMFTGGTPEMHRFISNTLSYPADAIERNAQGLVVYTFVVEKDGTLSNFNIIHRADPLLNEEACVYLRTCHHGDLHVIMVKLSDLKVMPMYFKLNKNAQYTTRPSSSCCRGLCEKQTFQ